MIWIVLLTLGLATLFLVAMYFNFRELAQARQAHEPVPLSTMDWDALAERMTQKMVARLAAEGQRRLSDTRAPQANNATGERNVIRFPSNHAEDLRRVA